MAARNTVKVKDWGYTEAGARKRFGVTDNFGNAGYILKNGDMLDFSEGGDAGRSQDHRAVVATDSDRHSRSALMFMFCAKFGAIRLFPYQKSCNADVFAHITAEQKSVMQEIAEYAPFEIIEVRAYDAKHEEFVLVKTFDGDYDESRIGKVCDAINSNFIDVSPAKIISDSDKPKNKILWDECWREDEAYDIRDSLADQHPDKEFVVEEQDDGTFSVYEIK